MRMQAHARLDLPFGQVRDWLVASPLYADRGQQAPDGRLRLAFGLGTLEVAPGGGATQLTLRSPDAPSLQALRDFVAETAREAGAEPVSEDRHRPGRPAHLGLARVAGVEPVGASFRRLWLEGVDLSRLMRGGLHFRLLIGPEGAGWPVLDAAGLTHWPGGAGAWHRPVYTVRHIAGEGEATRLGVDIFLHDGGRVTAWSAGLAPGQEVALMGPSGGDVPEGAGGPAPWFGLFGDETALPAIARMLAALPAGARGRAAILVPGADDIQPLAHPPGLRLDWLTRAAGQGLRAALAATPIPAEGRFVFFAADGEETAEARADLAARGLDRAEFWAQAYWR